MRVGDSPLLSVTTARNKDEVSQHAFHAEQFWDSASVPINRNHFTCHWSGPPMGGDMAAVYWCRATFQNKPGLEERGTFAPNSDHLECFWQLGRAVRCCCSCSGSVHGHLLRYPNPRGLGDGQFSGGRPVFHTAAGRAGWVARKDSLEGGCGILTFDQEVRMRNGSRGSRSNYCRFLVIDQISQKKQLMGRRISFSSWYWV